MKKVTVSLLIYMCLVALTLTGCFKESRLSEVEQFANSTIVKMGTDPIIVKAVKMENVKGKSIEKVKALDEKWKAAPGITDYMRVLMDSECGRHLRKIKSKAPSYAEIFVMDNQGANVAMSDKTSDYWQGDEDKFIKSYNAGKGGLHISEIKWDESSQANIVQVSVAVKENDKAIGALTIGLDVDQM